MTPDELVVIMLERLAKSKVDFTIENYATTRAAAERLLRTVGAVPEDKPKQIESSPRDTQEPARPRPYAMPHDALRDSAINSRTQHMPTYRRVVPEASRVS